MKTICSQANIVSSTGQYAVHFYKCYFRCIFRGTAALSLAIMVLFLPLPAGANADILDSLIQEGMENNQELQAIGEKARAQRAEVPFMGSLQDPVVTLGLANIPVDSFSFDQEAMTQKQLFISQRIPWFGKLDLSEQSALLSALQVESLHKQKRLQVAKEIRQAWYDLGFAKKSLQVNSELHTMVQQILQVAETRYSAGKGLQQDILAAQVQLSELLDEQVRLQSKKRVLQGRLGSLLNRREVFLDPGIESTLQLPLHQELNALTSQALEMNPLLIERRLEVDKARVEVELAEKAYMPDMSLRAGYGQREDDPLSSNSRADFFSASLSFTVPLWQSSRQDSKLAASEKRLESSKRSVAALEATLPHQIDSLISEIDTALESYELYRDALTVQAAQLAESSLAAYSVGKIEFGTMLASRIKTVRFELKAEGYKYQALKKVAELDELTGTPILPENKDTLTAHHLRTE